MSEGGREYRVGVVGLGGRGRQLARHWQGLPGARLVAVADLKPELLDKTREEVGDVACYADHQAMLAAADLDVVTIGTTGQFHAAITRDACARGIRAVYCEKPMACSLTDADVMINSCRDSGTVLQIGHQRRWMKSAVAIREAIQGGAIGQATLGHVYWPTGRVGSNGTHLFDAINFMVDSEPVEVVGRVQRGLDLTRVDEHPVYNTRSHDDPGVVGYITYANGARIGVDGSWDVLLPITYFYAGSRGRLDLDERAGRIDYKARETDTRSHDVGRRTPLTVRDFPQPGSEGDGDPERRGYREMLACIERGTRPTSTGEDGRLALETIVAFHLSSDAGVAAVSLPLPAEANDIQLTIH